MKNSQTEIIIESWKSFQNLSGKYADISWKLKTLSIGFWGTVIGYAYTKIVPEIYLVSLVILLLFLLIESGYKVLEYQCINKTIDLSKVLKQLLVEEEKLKFPERGVSSDLIQPKFKDYLELFALKRWLFWSPYIFLAILSIILFIYFKGSMVVFSGICG
jgi:hypothetical protein